MTGRFQVVNAARKFLRDDSNIASDGEFVQLRNGYRLFDPVRGVDYVLDMIYHVKGNPVVRRVHLTRTISSTLLLHQVCSLFSASRVFAF